MNEASKYHLPDDFAEQVRADIQRRAEEAGTILPDLLRDGLSRPQDEPPKPENINPDIR